MSFIFPSSRRIRKRSEYDIVFEGGSKISGKFLLAFVQASPEGSRVGLVVSRKWGNAVRRNRIKRLMREAFRLSADSFRVPVEIVLLPRHMPKAVKMNDIRCDLVDICDRFATLFAAARSKSKGSSQSDYSEGVSPCLPQ